MKDFDWINTVVAGVILYATGGIASVVIFAFYVMIIHSDMSSLKKQLTNEEGFTLVEIIAVLITLSILAWVFSHATC